MHDRPNDDLQDVGRWGQAVALAFRFLFLRRLRDRGGLVGVEYSARCRPTARRS